MFSRLARVINTITGYLIDASVSRFAVFSLI